MYLSGWRRCRFAGISGFVACSIYTGFDSSRMAHNRITMNNLGDWVKNSLKDTRELIDSGFQGAKSAVPGGGSELARAAWNSWAAAVLGACIGVAGGIANDDRKPARGAIVGGFLGAAMGLSLGMAWNARAVISSVAGNAFKNVAGVRDSQWLAKHPIDYA
jgi:hypothetical protein